jgi:hypothetical protein
VTQLAIDPSNPSTVYAGTACGLFKSFDGAATWRPLTNGIPTDRIMTIAVDPFNSRNVIAGFGSIDADSDAIGIFSSTDGGISWSQTLDRNDLEYGYTAGPGSLGRLANRRTICRSFDDPG